MSLWANFLLSVLVVQSSLVIWAVAACGQRLDNIEGLLRKRLKKSKEVVK